MPYNTTAILPPDETSGTSALPLARIKKIIKLDEDIDACTPGASYLITIATEMFIQYLTEQAYQMTRSERKPRRNIQYKDLANAVSRFDSLEFLTDVIPKTISYNKAVENRRGGLDKNGMDRPASNEILISEYTNGSPEEQEATADNDIIKASLDIEPVEQNVGTVSSSDDDLEMIV